MKITVAIPTVAGRSRYLASSIATCLAQPDDNLDILVSDNSPGEAEAVVRSFDDPRIRYVRPPKFLPMSAHWDFLLGHVDSDVISIIGDDDGLMPGSIAAVSRMIAEHGNVPIHHSLGNYFWPDNPRVERRNWAMFFHDSRPGGSWQDSHEYLVGVAAGRRRYIDGPGIYHNFLPMPLVRKIADGGPFFRRAIPDVYSALAIAAHTERFYSTGQFLTFSGTGARSNSASVDVGTEDGHAFFDHPSNQEKLFKPRFASRNVPLLLLDSLLEVAVQFGRPELAAAVDYPRFLEAAFVEATGTGTAADKRREILQIVRLAFAEKSATPFGARIARRAAEKAARAAGLPVPRRALDHTSTVAPIQLDGSVANIHQATIAVAAYLAGFGRLADAR